MRTLPSTASRQLQVKNDYDVVALRQEVRQVARELGLGLSQQAKIATAIGTVARALIAAAHSTTIRIRTEESAPRPTLEVLCYLSLVGAAADLAQVEQLLHFGQVRALVDDAALSLDGSDALFILRMWLSH